MDDASRTDVPAIPPEVQQAAEERSQAREARDWATADRLREVIEAAGWRVIDRGSNFRLEPASPPDIEVGGEIRYGRSDAVPSRLDEPEAGLASVILVVDLGDPATLDAVTAASHHVPDGVDLIVVGDAIGDATALGIREVLRDSPLRDTQHEVVRTSAPLGRAAALNIGIRRARAPIVISLDTSVEATDDVLAPLAAALVDPSVAVAGPFGLLSEDLRRFEEVPPADEPLDVAAIQGYLMAFRRADAAARGPLDEAFRFYRNLDIWWSLVLRDEGEGRPPRRAVIVPDLALVRREPWAWTSKRDGDRDRLSKRNFYRFLDRFRARPDLAVPAGT
jgi:glycosyl transferase family 2